MSWGDFWQAGQDIYNQWQQSGSGSGGNPPAPPSPPPVMGIPGLSVTTLAIAIGAVLVLFILLKK